MKKLCGALLNFQIQSSVVTYGTVSYKPDRALPNRFQDEHNSLCLELFKPCELMVSPVCLADMCACVHDCLSLHSLACYITLRLTQHLDLNAEVYQGQPEGRM